MARIQARAIAPRLTDRAVFVGQTGSGKTTLAEHLLSLRRFVVVYDWKGLIRWPGYRRYVALDEAIEAGREGIARILYAPDLAELTDPERHESFFRWVYLRQNCTLYVDETSAISTATDWPFHMMGCLARGRERNIETWLATQRPSRVPAFIFSESEHIYCFRLRMEYDADKVEAMTGISSEAARLLPKRQFFYAPQEGEIVGPMTLDLAGASRKAA